MSARRPARVAHLIQAELASLLVRSAKDPRLQAVTITAVRVSPDLRVADVYVRSLTTVADPGILKALRHASPFLRGEVGRALRLRVTPELRFTYDTVPDEAERVEALLRSAHPVPDAEEPE